MSNLFKSTVIKGTRLTDFSNTSAVVGVPIAFGYGTFPVDGNVIWAPLPPKEHVTRKRQGKGGVKQETYTYTLSYAIAFILGPCYGYLWIKRNGKVVYTTDPSAPVEDVAFANKWKQKVEFYYGRPGQLPDSTIEAYEGAGQVSAFPLLAYIVVEDDDVTDNGGAAPAYEAAVIATADTYFTSPPYPVLTTEEMENPALVVGMYNWEAIIDHLGHSVSIYNGIFGEVLEVYSDNPPDELSHSLTVLSGTHVETLKLYTHNPPDEMNHSIGVLSGVLRELLITYQNNPPDQLDTSTTIIGGSFT